MLDEDGTVLAGACVAGVGRPMRAWLAAPAVDGEVTEPVLPGGSTTLALVATNAIP